MRSSNDAGESTSQVRGTAGDARCASKDPGVTVQSHRIAGRPPGARFRGAGAVPGQDDRHGPPRHLRGAADRGRQSHAGAARDPDGGDGGRGGRRHVPARAAAGGADARAASNSLHELANGRYDYRIAETRKDEFGELYADFDKTAAALERRHTKPPASACRPRTSPEACSDALALARSRSRRWPSPAVPRRPTRSHGAAAGRRRRRARPGHQSGRRLTSSSSCAAATRSRRSPNAISATRARRGGSQQFNGVIRRARGPDRRVPLRLAQRDRRLRQRLSDVPILCYHRFGTTVVRKLNVIAGGVRAADGLSRAQRLHGHHAAATRALSRGQGAAAGQVGGDHDRRWLPLDVRDRVSDPAQVRLSGDGLPVHRLRAAHPTR